MANVPAWFMAEKTRHVEDVGVATEQRALRAAQENEAVCTHRHKTSTGALDFCDGCGKQFIRAAIRRRTGKTMRKRKVQRDV